MNFSEPLREDVERERDPLSVRITQAISRITSGQGAMRIPADENDPDLVLVACRDRIAELEEWKSNAEVGLQALRKQIGELELEYRDLMVKVRAGEKSTTSAG